MTYKLFIDDERYPIDDTWIIVRSYDETVQCIAKYGWPYLISFDHDLGIDQYSGKDIANWIVDCDLEHNVLPRHFSFIVHSQNPIGAKNIEKLLSAYLTSKTPS